MSTNVDGLSREVNSFNKRLDDVEESSKFVGAKFDQINKETVTVKSDMKKMTLTNSTQNKLLKIRRFMRLEPLISHSGILMTFYLSIILDLQNFFH